MKKKLQDLLALTLVFSLFSCSQPTQDTTKKEEGPKVDIDITAPEDNKDQKPDLKPTDNDYYFLYDNVNGNYGYSNEIGFSIEKSITSDLSVSNNNISVVDFYITDNGELYILTRDGKIIKHNFSKNNTFTKSNVFEPIPNEHFVLTKTFAVDGNNIILPTARVGNPDDSSTSETLIMDISIYSLDTHKITKTDLNFTDEVPMAIEVGPDKNIYVSTLKSISTGVNMNRTNYLYCYKRTDTKFEQIGKLEISNVIPEYNCGIISDLQYQNGALYAIATTYKYDGQLGGGIIKVIFDGKQFKINSIQLYQKDGADYTFQGDSIIGYPEATSSSKSFLYQPKKFIARKPKELVVSDEGFCYIEDKEKLRTVKACNSVVRIDISKETFNIAERIMLNNIDFSANNEANYSSYTDVDFDNLQCSYVKVQ